MRDGLDDRFCYEAVASNARKHGRIFLRWRPGMSWTMMIEDRPRRTNGPSPWFA